MENNDINAARNEQWRVELRNSKTPKERTTIERVEMPQLDPAYRITCNEEVNQGISAEQAMREATRCLDCANPQCVTGCPVNINIPKFIKNIERGNFAEAAATLKETSSLPAVCGRVCPQEKQCESKCIHLKMKHPAVAIGYLERFAADWQRNNADSMPAPQVAPKNGIKVAVIGSGPSGLSFAGDMIKRGYDVTVFEALHEIGGVLKYGIPEFRLPNAIVDFEIDGLRKMGVEFVKDCLVGKTITYDDLHEMGFKGVFVGSGAGFPRFMDIPGENLNGVMSSNEYLTRINLMGAGRGGDTPVLNGKTIAVVGGGNTAMDSTRTAKRMGAERVILVYRRSEEEMPARLEEVGHAKEEGIEFMTLHNPIEYIGDDKGRVKAMRVQRMELGEPDASGRRKPVPVEGAIEEIPVDLVIVAVGVSPNQLVPRSIQGLEVSKRNTIVVNEETMQSNVTDLYAGGDIVRGGATVILAMGDGRRAALNMHEMLQANN
ncbi:MAG: NADPH-dependent glutamate synthase [Muribaculaceae bacterium]|nr:NADPH-dependent glutamate synthase [Muribaculaceae bacterium]